jgi:hypothetical protein
MSKAELERLLDTAADDEELRAELLGVSSDRGLSDLAAALGFSVAVEDLAAMRQGMEMTPDDLEAVAAGGRRSTGWRVYILPQLEFAG